MKTHKVNRIDGSTENHQCRQKRKQQKLYERTGEVTMKGAA